MPDDRVLELPPSVVKAFGEASAVYTEIPMDSGTQMGIMGKVMLPDGTQLSEVIGQPLYDRMTAAAEKTLGAEHAGIGAMLGPLFQRMKPWAAMSQLSLLEFLPEMMAGKQPLDAMSTRAQSDGKKVGAPRPPTADRGLRFSPPRADPHARADAGRNRATKPGDRTQTWRHRRLLVRDMAAVAVMDDAMSGDRR